MAKELSAANFDEVVRSNSVVLVDFWAPWCGPCRMVGPFIDQIAAEYEGKAVVGKVNVDDNPDIAGRFQVSTIPTIMVFHNGSMVERTVGARPKAALKQLLDKYLN